MQFVPISLPQGVERLPAGAEASCSGLTVDSKKLGGSVKPVVEEIREILCLNTRGFSPDAAGGLMLSYFFIQLIIYIVNRLTRLAMWQC